MKKLIVVVLALVFVFAVAVPAFAGPGASDCGAGYGELHKFLATEGLTGQSHVPGLAHNGAVGICEVGVGR